MNLNHYRKNYNNYQQRGNDLRDTAAKVTISTCRVKVNDSGELIMPFEFACLYSQIPTITFGYQLQSTVYSGRVPIFSAAVKEYKTIERPPFSRLYSGASLSIVSESVDGLSFVVVATATGIAFSGPMSSNG